MLINNKFPNTCTRCSKSIPIDTQVEWTKGDGIRHITCPKSSDKFKDIKMLSFAEARKLTNCQLCESEANYEDKFYYESYLLCIKCWEENLGNDGSM